MTVTARVRVLLVLIPLLGWLGGCADPATPTSVGDLHVEATLLSILSDVPQVATAEYSTGYSLYWDQLPIMASTCAPENVRMEGQWATVGVGVPEDEYVPEATHITLAKVAAIDEERAHADMVAAPVDCAEAGQYLRRVQHAGRGDYSVKYLAAESPKTSAESWEFIRSGRWMVAVREQPPTPRLDGSMVAILAHIDGVLGTEFTMERFLTPREWQLPKYGPELWQRPRIPPRSAALRGIAIDLAPTPVPERCPAGVHDFAVNRAKATVADGSSYEYLLEHAYYGDVAAPPGDEIIVALSCRYHPGDGAKQENYSFIAVLAPEKERAWRTLGYVNRSHVVLRGVADGAILAQEGAEDPANNPHPVRPFRWNGSSFEQS